MPLPFPDVDSIQGPLEITYEEFKREDMVANFEHFAYQCWLVHEPGPANELLFIVRDLLEKYPQLSVDVKDIFDRYQKMVSLLLAASLAIRQDSEVQEFLSKRLLPMLKINDGVVDVRENLYYRLRLTGLLFLLPSEEQKNLARYIQQNTERIGQQNLSVLNAIETNQSTVGNWLKDYEQFFPAFTVRGSLERTRYLSEALNPRKLSNAERSLLLRVLEVYDFIRFPAYAWKEMGHEIPSRESKAVVAPTLAPTPTLSTGALFASVENELNIARERVNALSQGEIPKISRILYDNLFPLPGAPFDRALVLGSLILLAQEGWLLRILEEPNPVREAFVKYLREEGKAEDIAAFQLAPVSSLSLGKFLKFVLVRRMRMPESDGAQVAVRIGNILREKGKPQYFDMAYFDQGEGKFRWKG
ncbi:MAG: hypothetical protein Q7S48_04900 [bacterium]|nr:hypothetical protein [bacterium]